jgi:hypothetical protein
VLPGNYALDYRYKQKHFRQGAGDVAIQVRVPPASAVIVRASPSTTRAMLS